MMAPTRSPSFTLSVAIALAASSSASAFSTAPSSSAPLSPMHDTHLTQLKASESGHHCISTNESQTTTHSFCNSKLRRRDFLSSVLTLTLTATTIPPSPAIASLLDDFGTDPSNLNQQSTVTTTTTNNNNNNNTPKVQASNKGKLESNLEPNLRSNYYYPTNKVRYLPRIKKCSDAIPLVADEIGNQNWENVRDFATVIADDTILPMKLYVSSLTGGGTNVKVGFAKDMLSATKRFEQSRKLLLMGIEKKDVSKSSEALESMAQAMLEYRTSGKLLGPDGGGDIPSVDEIRRATKRFRGEGFEAKVRERDERVKRAAAGAAGN